MHTWALWLIIIGGATTVGGVVCAVVALWSVTKAVKKDVDTANGLVTQQEAVPLDDGNDNSQVTLMDSSAGDALIQSSKRTAAGDKRIRELLGPLTDTHLTVIGSLLLVGGVVFQTVGSVLALYLPIPCGSSG